MNYDEKTVVLETVLVSRRITYFVLTREFTVRNSDWSSRNSYSERSVIHEYDRNFLTYDEINVSKISKNKRLISSKWRSTIVASNSSFADNLERLKWSYDNDELRWKRMKRFETLEEKWLVEIYSSSMVSQCEISSQNTRMGV